MRAETRTKQDGARRIVCELDPSIRAEERILDALAACEEHDAELYVVWVLEPGRYSSTIGARAGGAGCFGLPAILGTAVELAAERGIRATSAVRFGQRDVLLRQVSEGRVAAPVANDRGTQRPHRVRRPSPRITSPEAR